MSDIDAQYAKLGYGHDPHDDQVIDAIDEAACIADEVLRQQQKHDAVLDQMKRQIGRVRSGDLGFEEHVRRTNAFMNAHRALQPAIGPDKGFIEPEKGPGYDTPQPATNFAVAAVKRRVPLKRSARPRPPESPPSYAPEIWAAAKKVP
jgi:hypothetical protein